MPVLELGSKGEGFCSAQESCTAGAAGGKQVGLSKATFPYKASYELFGLVGAAGQEIREMKRRN